VSFNRAAEAAELQQNARQLSPRRKNGQPAIEQKQKNLGSKPKGKNKYSVTFDAPKSMVFRCGSPKTGN
jgi:hypothetical protein